MRQIQAENPVDSLGSLSTSEVPFVVPDQGRARPVLLRQDCDRATYDVVTGAIIF
jgi:hypothetical protein